MQRLSSKDITELMAYLKVKDEKDQKSESLSNAKRRARPTRFRR